MLTLDVNPHDRHAALKRSLERDREAAWESANYEREQRDVYTSKLRFGSVVFNGASLVTVLNGRELFLSVGPGMILTAAAFFTMGVVLAGYSLLAHQTRLIESTGLARARAMILERAVTLADFPIGSDENNRLGTALDEAAAHQRDILKRPGLGALSLQNFSKAAWLGGVAGVAAQEVWRVMPPWPWF